MPGWNIYRVLDEGNDRGSWKISSTKLTQGKFQLSRWLKYVGLKG